MRKSPTLGQVVAAAVSASKSFAECADNFFNFERRASWRGWENWLTVEIIRRLDSGCVDPFFSYEKDNPSDRRKMDLFVDGRTKIAVEVKVNYIDDNEIGNWFKRKFGLPGRITDDIKKLNSLDKDIVRLLILSTFFESHKGLLAYPKLIELDLKKRFTGLNWKWYDCSVSGGGNNLLLVLSSAKRLPRENVFAAST